MADELADKPIFLSKKGDVSQRVILSALRELGIEPGDSIFLQTQLTTFGRLNIRLGSREEIFNMLLASLKEAVSSTGNLMMTTFSGSTYDTGLFDVNNTPSDGGVLTEYFRSLPDVERSMHPTHSFALLGPDKSFLDIDTSTFGDGSIYGKLYKKNATLLFFGARFHYCTFNHFTEERAKVPYRKKSTVDFELRNGKEVSRGAYLRYSKSSRFRVNFSRLEKALIEAGQLKVVEIGNGKMLAIKARDLYDTGMAMLRKDQHVMLDVEPPMSFYMRSFKTKLSAVLKRLRT